MKNAIIASVVALTASALLTNSASAACKPGYKPVKIQGNWVCMLDHGGPTNLSANPRPGIDAQIAPKKLKLRRQ